MLTYSMIQLLAQWAKLIKMLSVCLSVCVCLNVNHGGTNHNRCSAH